MRALLPVVLVSALMACEENRVQRDAAPGDATMADAGPADGGRRDTAADSSPPDAAPLQDGAPPDAVATDGGDLGVDAPPSGSGPFRVATFNCHCLIDNPALRAEGIAKQIVALNLDAVGLQEVCQTIGSGGSDNFASQLAKELVKLTKDAWGYRFGKTHVGFDTYDEGVGLLARATSIGDWGVKALPQGGGPFPRKVIWARINTDRGSFYLYSTHLTISSNWQDRVAQVNEILTVLGQHTAAPRIVVGDFNDKDWTGPIQTMLAGPPAFVDAWKQARPGEAGNTVGLPTPHERIDYVFIEQAHLSSIAQAKLAFDQQYQGVWLSDHAGVFVELMTK